MAQDPPQCIQYGEGHRLVATGPPARAGSSTLTGIVTLAIKVGGTVVGSGQVVVAVSAPPYLHLLPECGRSFHIKRCTISDCGIFFKNQTGALAAHEHDVAPTAIN